MSQSLLGRNPFIRVIGQQFLKQVFGVVTCVWRKQFFQPNSLLWLKIKLHMCCSTLESLDNFWLRRSKNIVNAMNLIEFVSTWEQWHLRNQFEQDTPESPNIHLLIIVTIGHEAFWSSIPPGGDVFSVGLLTMSSQRIRKQEPLHEPRSATLTTSSVTRIFYGLMSRWKIFLRCIYSMAFSTWNMQYLILCIVSGFFLFFRHSYRFIYMSSKTSASLPTFIHTIPVGSSNRTSINLMMFSWLLSMFNACISFSFFIFSTESNFFFIHLIATCLPVLSDRAIKTTENVPLPFSAYSLYWSMEAAATRYISQ